MTLTDTPWRTTTPPHGGGIATDAGSTATLTNTMLSGNFAEPGGVGGGISAMRGPR